jgi:hypothetical protein
VTAALIGLIGALVGLLVGSSYTFWSARRSELAAALIATAVLTEELAALRARIATATSRDPERLRTAWNQHREALVQHVTPGDFQGLAAAVAHTVEAPAAASDELTRQMDALAREFWRAHQAFILTPLIDYLHGNTLSKRVHAVLIRRDAVHRDS